MKKIKIVVKKMSVLHTNVLICCQDQRANGLELLQSCTKPSMCDLLEINDLTANWTWKMCVCLFLSINLPTYQQKYSRHFTGFKRINNVIFETQSATACVSLPILASWHHMATEILVNIGSGNGLLPDSTKPLPKPMLTNHQITTLHTCLQIINSR